MRPRRHLLALVVALAACDRVGFDVVSMRPIYGWVDGCTEVEVSGHGFDGDIQVTLGGAPLEGLTLPDAQEAPLDVGYEVHGRTPPSSVGADYATLVVTSGGETRELKDAFFYTACPGALVEALSADNAAAGDTVGMVGCGIDPKATQVQVGSAAPVPLTPTCSTAQASFTAPSLADGCYHVGLVDGTGTQVFPDAACDLSLPCEVPQGKGDTGDTGFVDLCAGVPTLTYGGGA